MYANNQNNIIRSSMHNYYIITILILLTCSLLILRFDIKYRWHVTIPPSPQKNDDNCFIYINTEKVCVGS